MSAWFLVPLLSGSIEAVASAPPRPAGDGDLPAEALFEEGAQAPTRAIPPLPEEHELAEKPAPAPPPPTCRTEAVFPGASWAASTERTLAERADAVEAFEAYAFSPGLDWGDKERRGVRTEGVVILKGGEIVYERYAHGYDADTPHLTWSVTKTVMGLLTGMATEQGVLDPDSSICDHIQGLPEASCAVTVEHLLQFASGFEWLETYEGYSPTQSSVLAMLYGEGPEDMGRFVASHGIRDAPGSVYMYSSGDTNLLSKVVDATLRPVHGARWPHVMLFDRLGMDSAVLERDRSDVPVGSSYWWSTPRDMARLGLFLQEDGCWQGERLVPEGWIDHMAQVNDAIVQAAYDRSGTDVQGRQLWLNRQVDELGMTERPWPHVPEDAFAALGHWKQMIAVVPSLDLVIVRTGDDRDGSFHRDRFLSLAMAVAGEGEVMPESDFALPDYPPQPATPPRDGQYGSSLFQLASGFAAKEACSCLFVAGRDADFCKDWTRVSPAVARFKADADEKRVKARALGMGKRVAVWVDDERGCRLEP